MSLRSKVSGLLAAGLLASVLVPASPGEALAANQDGQRETGESIYYYNSNRAGSYSDFSVKVANLSGYLYKWAGTTSAGKNTPVKNNAASAENKALVMKARIYYHSNFTGVSDVVNARDWKNLAPQLKNENASHAWTLL